MLLLKRPILLHLANDRLQQLGQQLGGVTSKGKIRLLHLGQVLGLLGLEVDRDDARVRAAGRLDVARGGPHDGRGADDEHQVGLVVAARADPAVNVAQDRAVQALAEPDHAGPLQARLALGALGQLRRGDPRQRRRLVEQRERLARLDVLGGRGEGRVERVVVVAVLDPAAVRLVVVEALDVEEGAVQEAQLRGRVVGPGVQIWGGGVRLLLSYNLYVLAGEITRPRKRMASINGRRGRTVYILRDAQEIGILPRQGREGVVTRVGLRPQGHVPAVGIEEPDEAGVDVERLGCGQGGGLIAPPQPTVAAERREPRGRGETSAAQCEDAAAGGELGVEGGDVVVVR